MPDDPPVTNVRHPCSSNAIAHPTFVSVRTSSHITHSGRTAGIDILLTQDGVAFTSGSQRCSQPWPMADFLAVLGIVGFVAVMLGLVWALDRV